MKLCSWSLSSLKKMFTVRSIMEFRIPASQSDTDVDDPLPSWSSERYWQSVLAIQIHVKCPQQRAACHGQQRQYRRSFAEKINLQVRDAVLVGDPVASPVVLVVPRTQAFQQRQYGPTSIVLSDATLLYYLSILLPSFAPRSTTWWPRLVAKPVASMATLFTLQRWSCCIFFFFFEIRFNGPHCRPWPMGVRPHHPSLH